MNDSEKHRMADIMNKLLGAIGLDDQDERTADEKHRQKMEEYIQNMQHAVQEALKNRDSLPKGFITLAVMVRDKDGTDVVLASARIPTRDSDSAPLLKELEGIDAFMSRIVIPALTPEQSAYTIIDRVDVATLAQNAAQALHIDALKGYIAMLKVDIENKKLREKQIRKYKECLDCTVRPCADRIEEPPEGYVPPSTTP